MTTHTAQPARFGITIAALLAASLACSTVLPGAKPTSTPNATAGITEIFPLPDASATPEAAPPTDTAEPSGEPVALTSCALLGQADAEAVLGEPAGAPKEGDGVCIFSDAATQVHVVSAYAAQGDAAIGKMNGRTFQLAAFGLLLDQTAQDELSALDQAADHKPYLEKLAALSAGNASFSSQVPAGVGDSAFWAWKDFGGGLHQGFLVAVRGDVLAGVDVVLGDSRIEAAALDASITLLNQIFDQLPPRFVMAVPEPTATVTPTELGQAVEVEPTIVPGGLIAFESDRGGGIYQLYLMNNDGTNQTQLSHNDLASSREPAWMPDGDGLAFAGQLTEDEASSEIFLIDADGQVQLTHDATYDGAPFWSPDGTQIVFLSRRDGNTEIYVMQADGSNPVRLTNTDTDELRPVWSPDAQWIVYSSPESSAYQLYRMHPDGTQKVQLTTDDGIHSQPAWSPDSAHLAYRHKNDAGSNIVVINADGTNPVDLTHNDQLNYAPAWSSDGAALAFMIIAPDNSSDIYRMNADGSNVTQLTISPAHDNLPAWQWQ